MSDSLRPELERVFDMYYPMVASVVGSHAARQLVRAMLQHAFHEGASWGISQREPVEMFIPLANIQETLGFTEADKPTPQQLAIALGKHLDHACGYGDCPVWCANRKPVCLCGHEPIGHGIAPGRGCLTASCRCERGRDEVEAQLEYAKRLADDLVRGRSDDD